jgi:hypothetical protein
MAVGTYSEQQRAEAIAILQGAGVAVPAGATLNELQTLAAAAIIGGGLSSGNVVVLAQAAAIPVGTAAGVVIVRKST